MAAAATGNTTNVTAAATRVEVFLGTDGDGRTPGTTARHCSVRTAASRTS